MTDRQETAAGAPTIEEQARDVLAAALDQVSSMVPGGKVPWPTTTLATMLRPVLIDLDLHLRKPMPPMPRLEDPEPSAEAIRRREQRQHEEQRYRWNRRRARRRRAQGESVTVASLQSGPLLGPKRPHGCHMLTFQGRES